MTTQNASRYGWPTIEVTAEQRRVLLELAVLRAGAVGSDLDLTEDPAVVYTAHEALGLIVQTLHDLEGDGPVGVAPMLVDGLMADLRAVADDRYIDCAQEILEKMLQALEGYLGDIDRAMRGVPS
jgi:hypothetical protein